MVERSLLRQICRVKLFLNSIQGLLHIPPNKVVVNKMHVLPNSRILIGGSFATYRGVSTPNFARLNADATLDTNFFYGFGASSRVNDFELQSDGKIVLGGAFDAYNGIFSPGLARIRPDGGPDKSFLAGFGADGEVHAVAIQSDGNILIGGAFDHYDTTNRARIARVLPSGKLDVSFDPGAGVGGTVYDIQVLSSGQILAAGVFTNYAGVAKNGLVRLNADGSLDATFTAPFEATAVVKEISVRPDGKIVAAGEFSLTGNNGRRNIARFNADGSLDATFSSNTLTSGANAAVNALSFCADGSLLIGGEFTTFDVACERAWPN